MNTESIKALYEKCCKTWKVKDSTTKQLRNWGSGPNEDFASFSRTVNDMVYGESMDLTAYQLYGKRLVEIALNAARWQSRSTNSPYYVTPRTIVAFMARCREINKGKYREEYEWFVTNFEPEKMDKFEAEWQLKGQSLYSLSWDPKYKPLLLRFAGVKQVDHPLCMEFSRALEWAKTLTFKINGTYLELPDELCLKIMNRVPPILFKHILVVMMIGGIDMDINEAIKAAKNVYANRSLQDMVQAMFVFQ